MKHLKFLFKWITESTARTVTGLLVLSIIVGIGTKYVHAATSWNVTNEVQMNLDVSITGSQTSGIVLSAPQINGGNYTFATQTGGVLRIRYGSYREDIYYGSGAVNATSKKVTLYGVVRNICPQNVRAIVSCGTGRSWGKGAIVELTVDARLLNLKLNEDRTNTGTGLFSIRSLQTAQPWLFPNGVTTAQSNAFTYGKGSTDYHIIFDTTLGLMKYWNGSSYVNFGSGSTTNASDTVAGKVQIISLSDQKALTATGATGAQNVLSPRWMVKNGSGVVTAGRIPELNSSGVLSVSLGGLGRHNMLSGALLIGQGVNAVKLRSPGTAGTVLKSNGTEWITGAVPAKWILLNQTAYSSLTDMRVFNNTNLLAFTGGTVVIPANTMAAAGDRVLIDAVFDAADTGTPTLAVKAKVGAAQLANANVTGASGVSGKLIHIKILITCQVAGSSGKYTAVATIFNEFPATATYAESYEQSLASIDWTAQQTIIFYAQWGTAATANTVAMLSSHGHAEVTTAQ